MQLRPGTSRSGAVLVFQQLAGAEHLQAGAVDPKLPRKLSISHISCGV